MLSQRFLQCTFSPLEVAACRSEESTAPGREGESDCAIEPPRLTLEPAQQLICSPHLAECAESLDECRDLAKVCRLANPRSPHPSADCLELVARPSRIAAREGEQCERMANTGFRPNGAAGGRSG